MEKKINKILIGLEVIAQGVGHLPCMRLDPCSMPCIPYGPLIPAWSETLVQGQSPENRRSVPPPHTHKMLTPK